MLTKQQRAPGAITRSEAFCCVYGMGLGRSAHALRLTGFLTGCSMLRRVLLSEDLKVEET